MKILFSAAVVVFALAISSFKNPGNGEGNDVTLRTYTLKELKATYGDNIVVGENVNLESLSEVVIMSSANPCAGSGMQPCGAAEAHARAYAQQLANSCCCTVTFGWECCDPATGTMFSALFFTEPNNCH